MSPEDLKKCIRQTYCKNRVVCLKLNAQPKITLKEREELQFKT